MYYMLYYIMKTTMVMGWGGEEDGYCKKLNAGVPWEFKRKKWHLKWLNSLKTHS